MSYDHKNIDKKWQKRWEDSGVFNAKDFSDKEKFYCLIEFPYPSGAGLHIGHPRSYTALDIIARQKRMQGKNVLYPIGWDAFGLPTENFAIKTGKKPQQVTKENTDTFRKQLKSLGFSFDWSREINTTDPEYYKWTQWMFLQFFKNDLAYKKKMPINWCLSCKIGLANEEVVNGVCERCGEEVEKRDKEQWMIAITKYADRLLEDLDTVDYLPKIKKQQQDWIGRSEGAEVDFEVQESNESIKVFTTRPDTLFGATYMVLAPEHELVSKIVTDDQRSEVEKYISDAARKSDIERGDVTKEKTGVFTGAYAINPVSEEKIPIWVADYVMMGYGTGAIMAVPAHDERDFEFAKKYNLEIVEVVQSVSDRSSSSAVIPSDSPAELDEAEGSLESDQCFVGNGVVVNSDFLNGLKTKDAIKEMNEWLKKNKKGDKAVNYKLRDWIFSRQRYWGEPIPLVDCDKCGWVPIPDSELPVVLPEVEKYEPTDTGESPLAAIEDWVNVKCPKCGADAKRETDTMPNWAGSSWYFLAYAMHKELGTDLGNGFPSSNSELIKYWLPVDLYNGGMEHTTLHLLYSRFWHKFLFDHGFVSTSEPYARRHSHGLILAEDGHKMSKSKGNVVNPDEIVDEYGADTLRVYEMFMGPFEEPVPWNIQGLKGVRKFLDKVVRLSEIVSDQEDESVTRELHKTIKKVTEDINGLHFNTAVAQMMIFVNQAQGSGSITKDSMIKFLQVLCPFAPHISNELAEQLGESKIIEEQEWPEYDSKLIIDDVANIAVQVNGKLRGEVQASPESNQDEIDKLARADENVSKYLEGEVQKVIYVQGKLINFVVK